MHLCLTLQSKLNEMLVTVNELSDMADRVRGAQNFKDFESMKAEVEKEIEDVNKEFEKMKTELNGLKLNFEEELVEYLGVPNDFFDIAIDDDGYITRLSKIKALFFNLREANPDLSWLCKLLIVNLKFTNVENPKLPEDSIIKVNFKGCEKLAKDYDMSKCLKLRKANFARTNVENPKLPKESMDEVNFWNCKKLAKDYDMSKCSKMLEARVNSSSVEKIFISFEQYAKLLSGELKIEKDDDQEIIVSF